MIPPAIPPIVPGERPVAAVDEGTVKSVAAAAHVEDVSVIDAGVMAPLEMELLVDAWVVDVCGN